MPDHKWLVDGIERRGDAALFATALARAPENKNWWRPKFPEDTSVMEAICRHSDASRRRVLLDQASASLPAGHPFWTDQLLDTLAGSPFEWEFVRARGGRIPALSTGMGLLEKAVLARFPDTVEQEDTTLLEHLLLHAADHPEHVHPELLQKAWKKAVSALRPRAMRALLAHGADPWAPCEIPVAIELLKRAGSIGGLSGWQRLPTATRTDLSAALALVASFTRWKTVEEWLASDTQEPTRRMVEDLVRPYYSREAREALHAVLPCPSVSPRSLPRM